MRFILMALMVVASPFVKLFNFLIEDLAFLNTQTGSFEITTAFVEGFKSNIYMLSQQKNARLFNKSRQETQNSKTDYYERIGAVDAQEVTNRHGDTPIMNTPHSRRAVTLSDAEYGDMIDKLDRVRLLINPDSSYVQAAVNALNRRKDDVFIAAALGTARAGEDGEILVSLPNKQRIVALSEDLSKATNLNVSTLTRVGKVFDDADVEDDDVRYFAYTGSQKQAMLNQEKATSADYASVKALVEGRMDTFLGFIFIRSERLPVTAAALTYDSNGVVASSGTSLSAGARRCFAWVEDGMLSSTGLNLFARVSERADKRYGTQIYVCDSVGAVRMEEEKVVEVLCTE